MIKPKVNHSKRTVGIQSIIQPKLYDSPKTLAQKNLETVEYSRLFYHSHTLIALFLGICILQVLIWYSKDWDLYDIQALAAKACILLILLFSSFYMPDTIVTRPHPFVWRMVLAANLIYAAFLVYLSFLPLDHARKTIKIFDSRLGDPLPAKSYAEDCRLYTPENPTSMFYNFSDKFYDVHTAAHLFGWIAKVFIIRDVKLCWICSLLFELLEITFRHWLPIFNECWWDHFILDIFGCNMLGIIAGSFILKKLSMNTLDWIYAKQITDEKNQNYQYSAISRAFSIFNWEIFISLKRFYGVLFYIAIVSLVDLNNFFMKQILFISSEHDILKWRLVLWCPLALSGTEEFFEYMTNKYSKRVRPHMWIVLLLMSLEVGFIYKHHELFSSNPFPYHIKIIWTLILGIIVLISVCIVYKNIGKKDEDIPWNPYDPPIDIKEASY